jgi:hypothetical protein
MHNSGRREEVRRIKAETSEPEEPHKGTRGRVATYHRGGAGARAAHHRRAPAPGWRREITQLEGRRTGMPFCRTRADATVATRCFESYTSTVGSFNGDAIPALEDKVGS